jgi:hypothetical protein
MVKNGSGRVKKKNLPKNDMDEFDKGEEMSLME